MIDTLYETRQLLRSLRPKSAVVLNQGTVYKVDVLALTAEVRLVGSASKLVARISNTDYANALAIQVNSGHKPTVIVRDGLISDLSSGGPATPGNPNTSTGLQQSVPQVTITQSLQVGTTDTFGAMNVVGPTQFAGQMTIAPAFAAPPFILNTNAQNHVVTGLLADHVNKSVVAGDGLLGGGSLASGTGVTLQVDTTVLRSTGHGVLIASATVLGHIKVGSGLSINASTGVLTSTGLGGTVTSVALTAPAIFSVSGSPITGSGTLGLALATQAANLVWAGPASGVAAAPTFRSLVAADILPINLASTANGGVTGTLPAANGGTGQGGGYAVGDLLYASAASALSKLAAVATGNVLISGGVTTAPAWGKVGLTTHVSGILPSTSGGTGVNNAGTLTLATSATITGGGTLALGGFTLTVGATGTVVLTSDARLTDSRTPLAHAASHSSGGSDPVTISNLAGTITDAQHGSKTTGTLHAVVTGTVAGFMSSADFTKLAGIATGAQTGTVTSVALTTPAIFSVSGSPVTTTGTLAFTLATQGANLVWAGPTSGAAATPTFRALVVADIPTHASTHASGGSDALAGLLDANARVAVRVNTGVVVGTRRRLNFISSTGITIGAVDDSGSEEVDITITATGGVAPAAHASTHETGGVDPLTLSNIAGVITDAQHGSKTTGTLHAVVTGTVAGFMSSADFTKLAGIATGAQTGTVTSVALTTPAIFSVSGSPVTTTGTLGFTLATQSANLVWAGPTTGVAAAPTFRGLVVADIPAHASTHHSGGSDALTLSSIAGVITDAQHGSKTTGTLHAAVIAAGASGFMTGTDKTKLDSMTSGASVSSVALTVPAFLSVAGSPITTSGTLAVTLATETANTVFAGPTTGVAAAPTFRALVAADVLPINLASTANGGVTGTLPATNGGTGQASYAIGDLLYASTTTALSRLADIATTNVLKSGGVGAAPSWGKLNLPTDVQNILGVTNGGTGLSSYAVGDLLYASGIATIGNLNDTATGNALLSGGLNTAPAWGKVTLTGHVSGILPVANGGTNTASYITGDILYASAAGVISSLADVAVNSVILSGGVGVAPLYGKVGLTTHVSGILPVANGGTNIASYTIGDILYASASGVIARLTAVATGNVLRSGGVTTAPLWGQVVLTTDVTGTLPIANGGTNAVTAPAALVSLNAAVAGQVLTAGAGLTGGGTHGTTTSTITFDMVGVANGGITVNANDVQVDTTSAFTPTWAGVHTFNAQPVVAANLQFSGARSITSTSANNLTLAPGGNLLVDPVGNNVLPVTGYDINLGSLSQKYLSLHAAELWVETLVAQNTLATIGGRILVGPTTTLTADLTAIATTITVKHNQMVNGDRVYMEANGSVESMAITSAPGGTGPYTYSVTRDLDGTGANAWSAGDAVFNTGQTGNGFIDLYSVRGVKTASQVGPTMVMNVRNSGTFNDWSEHAALGNLNGLYDYGSTTYGVAFGKQTAHWIGIDATQGVRFMVGTTMYSQWSAAGNIQVGRSTLSNVQINTGGDLLLATNGITNIKLDNTGIITLGDAVTNDRHYATITTSGFAFTYKNASAVSTTMFVMNTTSGIPYLLLGPLANANIYAYNGDVNLRQGTTNYIVLNNSGVITVGAPSAPQLTLTSSVIQLKNASGVVGFQVNSSGNMNLLGVLDIGSSGGIYQGGGTFASPTTGLKIWNASGTGRIAGYSSGTEQWGAQTDGTLTAGAGNVILSASGISIKGGLTLPNAVTWVDTAHANAQILNIEAATGGGFANGYLTVEGTDATVPNALLFLTARNFTTSDHGDLSIEDSGIGLYGNTFGFSNLAGNLLSYDPVFKWTMADDVNFTGNNLYFQGNPLVFGLGGTVAYTNQPQTFSQIQTFSLGITVPRTGDGYSTGFFNRYWEAQATSGGIGASTGLITTNADYGVFTTGWEFMSTAFGGQAGALAFSGGLTYYTASGATLIGDPITWVSRFAVTNAGVLSTSGNIVAGGTISGTNVVSTFIGPAGTAVITTQQVIAGSGLTGGGAFGAGNVTLTVGAGTGISVGATTVGIDTGVVPRLGVANTFTANQTINPAAGSASLAITSAAGNPILYLDGASGVGKQIRFTTGGIANQRWIMQSNATAESGGVSGTTGSDFLLQSYDNSGVLQGSALTITRSLNATFGGNVTVTGTLGSTNYPVGASISGNFALTLPAAGTAALLGTNNVFTIRQDIVASGTPTLILLVGGSSAAAGTITNRFYNATTTGLVDIALSEANSTTPAYIRRYGSTHASQANNLDIGTTTGDIRLVAASTERLRVTTTGVSVTGTLAATGVVSGSNVPSALVLTGSGTAAFATGGTVAYLDVGQTVTVQETVQRTVVGQGVLASYENLSTAATAYASLQVVNGAAMARLQAFSPTYTNIAILTNSAEFATSEALHLHLRNTTASGDIRLLIGNVVKATLANGGDFTLVNNLIAANIAAGFVGGNGTAVLNTQQVIAGNGLTGGGAFGAGNVTLTVGPGTGISVAATTVGIDTAVVPRLGIANTFTANQTIALASGASSLTISSTNSNPVLFLDGIAGQTRDIRFTTAGIANTRWTVRADGASESGADVGSDFRIYNHHDSGVAISPAFTLTRSTGRATFVENVIAGGTVSGTNLPAGLTLTGSGTAAFTTGGTVAYIDQAQTVTVQETVQRTVVGQGTLATYENLSVAATAFSSLQVINGTAEARLQAFSPTYTTIATLTNSAELSTAGALHLQVRNATASGDIRFLIGSTVRATLANGGDFTLVNNLIAANIPSGFSATGAGTLATGGFTLTVPATGTAALLGVANTFLAAQTISSTTNPQLTLVNGPSSVSLGTTSGGAVLLSAGASFSLAAGTNIDSEAFGHNTMKANGDGVYLKSVGGWVEVWGPLTVRSEAGTGAYLQTLFSAYDVDISSLQIAGLLQANGAVTVSDTLTVASTGITPFTVSGSSATSSVVMRLYNADAGLAGSEYITWAEAATGAPFYIRRFNSLHASLPNLVEIWNAQVTTGDVRIGAGNAERLRALATGGGNLIGTWNTGPLVATGAITATTTIAATGTISGSNISATHIGGSGTAVLTTRQVLAGNGNTGGGALSVDQTITLGTPSTLTASTTNNVLTSSHTHAITSSSAPGAAVSLLSTSASGAITLNGQVSKILAAVQTADVTNSFVAQTNRNYETGITFYANRAATTVDWAYQLVTPSTWTDVTLELQEVGGTSIVLFPTGSTTTQMHMGAAAKFTELYYLPVTLGVGGTYVWEYSTGAGTWSSLTTSGTADFTAAGYVTWVDPGAGWVTATYNGQTGFWIRVRATVAPTTAPTASAWNISVANGDFFRGTTASLIKFRINVNGSITSGGTIQLGDGLAGTVYNSFTGNILSGYSGGLKASAQFQVGSVLGVGGVPSATTQALVMASAVGNVGLQVNGFSASTTADLARFWTSANQGMTVDKLGRVVYTQTTAPTIAAGTGAGGTPTLVQVVAGSTDVVGTINITTGGVAPVAGAIIATITFTTAWGAAPKNVRIDPANAATAALTSVPFVSSITTTTFVITANAVALANTTAYSWRYHAVG